MDGKFDYKKSKNIVEDLEQRLKQNDGQIVLLDKIVLYRRRVAPPGIWSGVSESEQRNVEAGIIVPPYVKSDKRDSGNFYSGEITVNPRIGILPPYPGQHPENIVALLDGNIKSFFYDFTGEERRFMDAMIHDRDDSNRTIRFDIYIGDALAKKFLVANYEIGLPLYEHVNELLKNPAKIQEIKDLRVKEKKEKIIESLERLLIQEREYQARVDAIYHSIKRGGFMEDDAFSPVETKDDAYIVSRRPREEIEETRQNIIQHLEEAKKLGMHEDKSEYVVETTPGKRTTIKISEYISGLTEKYSKLVTV